jgi:hypothetical protein
MPRMYTARSPGTRDINLTLGYRALPGCDTACALGVPLPDDPSEMISSMT